MNKQLCIYHGNCADGFGAAWVIWKKFPETEFVAGVYQQDPPNVKDRDVILVDFSYKRPVMEQILRDAASVTIIDHHKTAIADLEGLEFASAIFDVNHSGAMLTWQAFNILPPPPLIQHIEDRDLWRFALPKTREIQAAVFSYPYEFEVWDKLMTGNLDGLIREGMGIERKHFKDIRELLKVCRKRMVIDGHEVLAANLPYTLSSDAGHIICEEEKEPFGCCFYAGVDGVNFSLRSIDSKLDVSEIAKKFGGGGHRNAAGFRVSVEQAREFEDDVIPF